ncbi:type II secretion system F family protein [Salmonella enterica subsp. enterica serovar Newport]|nr:type II secretion system F family protein [Salmonella enterica subsp. enterica serovar Newport]
MYTGIMLFLIAGGFFFLIQQSKNKKRRGILTEKLSGLSSNTKLKKEIAEPVLTKIHKRTSKVIGAMDLFEEKTFLKIAIVFIINLTAIFIHYSGIFTFTFKNGALLFIITIIFVILAPAKVKKIISARRVKKISTDLPFAIDIMAICIRSGMTIENAFSYISKNFSNVNPDIAILFERTSLKTEVSGISEALDQLYEEVPSPEVRMFCSTLQQSVSFGSSIYPILVELSRDIREMQLISVEEKVASLSAKMSAPMILFIMFPILAIVAGPGFIRMMNIWSN